MTAGTTPTEPSAILRDIDLYDPTLPEHLHGVLAHARSQCPVTHSSSHGGYWLVTDYAGVRSVLKDAETFSSAHGITVPHRPEEPPMPPLHVDAPIHRDYRQLLNPFLTPSALAPHVGTLRRATVELIEAFADRGRCELLTELAMPVPALGLARIILAADDEDEIRELQKATMLIGSENAGEGFVALQRVARNVLDARIAAVERGTAPPRDDVLAALLNGTVEGRPLTDQERIGTLMILLLGGLDTTTNAIANIVYHVATTPGLEDRLRDPAWVSRGLDEFLRMDSPVQYTARYVTKDTEVGGRKLCPGDWVVAHLGSANRDEDQFTPADRLTFDRESNRHLAFGLGRHRCVGSNLARLQITVVFEELLARVSDIRLAPGTDVSFTSGMSRKPKRLDITFNRRG
ncbi:cytochrome P450 [Actinomadura rugatobispora]|uniref:Cytochrome P450 n=1 Tax=Actinomadura rugatobispora TaxID=1994 RepID=A0ABW1A5V0_9ACTN|nr:cytochrome P450 [Actinomadura rugatobispora]